MSAAGLKNQLVYSPLNPREIRLLKLRPEDGLSFDIVHVVFENAPPYGALSYCWGVSNPSQKIFINGSAFYVRSNLFDALERFRLGLRCEKAPWPLKDYIWIDAICIDQDNLDERSAQVSLMTRLYEDAKLVLVWLGNPQDNVANDLGMKQLKVFENSFRSAQKKNQPFRPWWWPTKVATGSMDVSTLLTNVAASEKLFFDRPGTNMHRAWLGICNLYKNSYWTRTWIMQESSVCDSKRTRFILGTTPPVPSDTVIFVCGNGTTTWSQLTVSLYLADHFQALARGETSFMDGTQENMRKVLLLRSTRKLSEPLPFLGLLQQFREARCTNPLDKIYAPLGLVDGPVRSAVVPNYRSSFLEASLTLAKYLIQKPEHELDLLGYAWKRGQPARAPSEGVDWTKWPSWLPNWDDPITVIPFPKTLYIHGDLEQVRMAATQTIRTHPTRTVSQARAYNASRSLIAPNAVRLQGTCLQVFGHVIDTISDSVSYKGPIQEVNKKIEQWKCFRNKRGNYITDEPIQIALNRMQIADVAYAANYGRATRRGASIDNTLLRKTRDQLTAAEHEAQRTMRDGLRRSTAFRSLCVTQRGYMGLVPREAKPGDRVCTFVGGQVLYVIRPGNGAAMGQLGIQARLWEYVGECYLHGLMDGEIARDTREGAAIVLESFLLQ